MTAADGGINSLTYGCAIDRTVWGGEAHRTNLPQRLKNQGQALTCDYFFHFLVNAWSVGSEETNPRYGEPETGHVKESKEICQERRINQRLKYSRGNSALSKVRSNYFVKTLIRTVWKCLLKLCSCFSFCWCVGIAEVL